LLQRIEYWLLDVAAEFAVPLQALPAGEIELAFNRPSLGASNAELARGLARLHDLGLVALHLEEERTPDALALERLISKPPVDGFIYESGNHYRLTATGGAEWERAARPDWNGYVEYRTWPEGDVAERSIVCADPSRAEHYLAYQRAVWLKQDAVAEESVVREVFRPWQATYWKVLPEAYVIRFRTPQDAGRYPACAEAARWDYRWHGDPWEGR
jgi:hypothetical protein